MWDFLKAAQQADAEELAWTTLEASQEARYEQLHAVEEAYSRWYNLYEDADTESGAPTTEAWTIYEDLEVSWEAAEEERLLEEDALNVIFEQ